MLAIAVLAAAMATSPKPGELKSFDDWAVGCDNGRACTAVSLMEMESGENQLTVQIVRGPGRGETARLRIANIENRQPGSDVSFILDGTTQVATAQTPRDDAPIEIPLDAKAISAMRNGKTLELRDANGASLGSTSLQGMTAALLYMDDKQLRAKSVTALIANGPAPANVVPLPPPLPSIAPARTGKAETLKLSADDMARLHARTTCDAEDSNIEAREAIRIDKRTWLALVPCGAGAYNYLSVPVLVSSTAGIRKMKVAEFDFAPGFTEGAGPPLLVNAGWDAATGRLSSYAKGRGLGDCGSAEDYVWDGKRFRLVGQVAMQECRGVIDWITTWRANVAKRK